MRNVKQSEDRIKSIRQRMRDELPQAVFEKRQARMLWSIPLLLGAVVGWWLILAVLDSFWSKLIVSVVVAHCLAGLAFMAHEVLHGAMGGSRKLQNLVAWPGLGAILTPPEFWRTWHNRVHHGHTNHKLRDPDHFGVHARYRKSSFANRMLDYAPGSGHPLSLLFCFYSFSLHSLVVLWGTARKHPGFKGRLWTKERIQSLMLIAGWVGLGVVSGKDALYTVIIPFFGANFVIQSYIVTNHWLRPLTAINDPLANSLSLVVPKFIDPLHFRFSHHAEHHLWPGLASSQLPKVRQWLLSNCPGDLALSRYGEALGWLYRTPRTYKGPTRLASLEHPEREFDLESFGDYLVSDFEGRRRGSVSQFWRNQAQAD